MFSIVCPVVSASILLGAAQSSGAHSKLWYEVFYDARSITDVVAIDLVKIADDKKTTWVLGEMQPPLQADACLYVKRSHGFAYSMEKSG